MQILGIASYKIYPAKMGGQKGVALFYKYLSAITPVTLITTANNGMPNSNTINCMPILSNGKLKYINLLYFFGIKKIIKQKAITHIILEHPYYGWLGILLKWFTGCKLIIHSHNIEALRFKSTGSWWWFILGFYEKWVHKMADFNFFIHDNDRNYAINNYKLKSNICTTITYGIERCEPTTAIEKQAAKKQLCELHGINIINKLILFNGTLNYEPNTKALDIILQKINPALINNFNNYTIIICGNKLPASYNNLSDVKNVLYAGFVNNIDLYFTGCDMFINPVVVGGGIKTKLVEALAFNLKVITTKSGAIGIPNNITGENMRVVEDENWEQFIAQIKKEYTSTLMIPKSYFDYFYWGSIAKKAAKFIGV